MPDFYQDFGHAPPAPLQGQNSPDFYKDFGHQVPQQASAPQSSLLQKAQSFAGGAAQGIARVGQSASQTVDEGIDAATGLITKGDSNAVHTLGNANKLATQQANSVFAKDESSAPGYGTAGEIVGAGAATAPLYTAGGLVKGAIQGAAGGLLNSDPSAPIEDKLLAMGIGGLTAGTMNKIPDIASILKGTGSVVKNLFTSPKDLLDRAEQNTLASIKPGLDNVTPETYFKEFQTLTDQAKAQKDLLYNIRNKLAENEGVSVNRNELSKTVSNLKDNIKAGATSDIKSAYSEGKDLLGDNRNLPYSDSQKLVSDIGAKINTANNQGNVSLANALHPLKNALLADIENGGGSQAVKDAHSAATDYYANVYSPLRNTDVKDLFANHFSEQYYLTKALNKVMQDPNAMRAASPIKDTLIAAHLNAIKDSFTDDTGNIVSLPSYANALSKTLEKNPGPLGEYGRQIKTLGDAIKATNGVQNIKKLPSFITGVLGFGTGYFTNPSIGAGIIALHKAPALFTSAKLLSNPEVSSLLNARTKITDPNVAKAIDNKISTSFMNRYTKYAKSMGVSAETNAVTQAVQQQGNQ